MKQKNERGRKEPKKQTTPHHPHRPNTEVGYPKGSEKKAKNRGRGSARAKGTHFTIAEM